MIRVLMLLLVVLMVGCGIDTDDGIDQDQTDRVAMGKCVPNCAGKQCGTDGCNGTCGTCAAGSVCKLNQCMAYCTLPETPGSCETTCACPLRFSCRGPVGSKICAVM